MGLCMITLVVLMGLGSSIGVPTGRLSWRQSGLIGVVACWSSSTMSISTGIGAGASVTTEVVEAWVVGEVGEEGVSAVLSLSGVSWEPKEKEPLESSETESSL